MSAPWEKTRYPFSFAGVGFDKPIEVVDCDALPPVLKQMSGRPATNEEQGRDGSGVRLPERAAGRPSSPAPTEVAEARLDDLVGLAAGVIEHRRVHQAAYGALEISDEQRDELARAFVANLLAAYSVERLP